MLYILSGVAKSGKSYVSHRMRDRLKLSCFSTDYLMVALGKGNPNLNIDIDADDDIVAKHLEPYLYSMIENMVANNVSYILEGVHFNPDFVAKLLKDFPGKIKLMYMIYPQIDIKEKAAELKKYSATMENCWFASFSDERLENMVSYMKNFSIQLEKACNEYHLPYYIVHNIVDECDEIIKILVE